MKPQSWCFDQFLVLDKLITNAKFHFYDPAIWLQNKFSFIKVTTVLEFNRKKKSEKHLLYFI